MYPLYLVDGHRGETHPAVSVVVEHGRVLAGRVDAGRRAAVISATGATLGRLSKQTTSSRAYTLQMMFSAFGQKDQQALVAAFKSGEASKLSSPVNIAGFLGWDGSPLPKLPKRLDTPRKPASASSERVQSPSGTQPSKPDAKRLSASKSRALESGASEDQIQIAVADALRANERPGLFWFHPANGGYRSKGTAAKFKAMGVRPGVPDLIIIIGGKVYALELKRAKSGTVSAEQREAHAAMVAAGATVATAKGYTQAIETLRAWGAIN